MKNTFIKILCLTIALVMLLASCNAGNTGDNSADTTAKVENNGTEAPTTGSTEEPTGNSETTVNNTETPSGETPTTGGNSEEPTTEVITDPVENLVTPKTAQQVVFCPGMFPENYFAGLSTGYTMELTEVDGNTVMEFFCKKRSTAKVTFDYEAFMTNSGATPLKADDIQSVLFMVQKGEVGKFTKFVYSASEALTVAEDGTIEAINLVVLDDMRKNNTWYVSSIALIYDTEDILLFSELHDYVLGYSETIKIEPENKVDPDTITAPSGDPTLDFWFDHITERVAKYTVAPTTMGSYTINMAKNEYEGCQFFLHSATNRKITLDLSTFTNANGDTLETELGVEFYIEEGWLPIKGYPVELVYPDAVIPYASYISQTSGGTYEEGAWVSIGPSASGKETSQGFVIQAKTTKDSKPGLYKAILQIYDANTGECIKTAEVYTYVYNVTMSDEPALDTTFLVWDGKYAEQFDGNKQGDALIALYNFMLEYRVTPRLSGWVVNDLLCRDGNYEWLYNPRVTTLCVLSKAQYDQFKDDPILAEKMYFYGQDEPGVPRGFYRSVTLEDGTGYSFWDPYGILTVMGMAEEAKMLQNWGWENYRLLIPFERDIDFTNLSIYPTAEQTGILNLSWKTLEDALYEDANVERRNKAIELFNKYKQELIDSGDMVAFMEEYVNMWVPILYAYTPRQLGELFQGCRYLQSATQDALFGEYFERINKLVEEKGHEKWAYVACNPKYDAPYQNLLLFCDGTSPETMMWTCFVQDVTGFLYWHVSNYGTDGRANNNYCLRAPFPKEGAGDGILVYPGSAYGQIDPIPSIRFIGLRDGIEDYELLTMLESVKGEEYAKELASFIATSAITFTEDDQLLRDVRNYMLQILEAELNK